MDTFILKRDPRHARFIPADAEVSVEAGGYCHTPHERQVG